MYYLIPEKNEYGQYNPLCSFKGSKSLVFPDKFFDIFYPCEKRASGFVDIEHDGTTVTSCTWNEAAYQNWVEQNPPLSTENEPTLDDRVSTLETETADLNEALNMILTGVTE